MSKYPHIAQRLFNTPLALSRRKAETIAVALRERFDIEHVLIDASASSSAFEDTFSEEAAYKPYQICEGIAIIPVSGSLVQKLGTLRPYSGMTGYDTIRANLSMALADEQVHAIAFDIDSPGGEVSGCFDLADEIYEARGQKPMWSILSESAYSAAYAIASATDRIIVPRTGGTGSVGVICLHTDYSKYLDMAGITVTIVQYGDRKSEGNELEPLTDDALAAFQADIDIMGDLFVSTVARNREMSTAKVRATQAATYLGAAGVTIGFADAVMSPNEAFAALYAEIK